MYSRTILKKNFLYSFILVLAMVICLCSCSTKSHLRDQAQQFDVINNKIFNWTINGKISWHNKLNHHAGTCYINWKKLNDKTQIRLQSALNLENLVIESDSYNKIKVLSKNGKIYNYSIDDAIKTETDNKHIHELEQIKETINNISFNIDHLNYWLLGIPSPSHRAVLTKNGFKQAGWEVTYSNYKKFDPYYDENNQLMLPSKIVAINHKLQITIKIVVLDRGFP